jgi:hypothetical protein
MCSNLDAVSDDAESQLGRGALTYGLWLSARRFTSRGSVSASAIAASCYYILIIFREFMKGVAGSAGVVEASRTERCQEVGNIDWKQQVVSGTCIDRLEITIIFV